MSWELLGFSLCKMSWKWSGLFELLTQSNGSYMWQTNFLGRYAGYYKLWQSRILILRKSKALVFLGIASQSYLALITGDRTDEENKAKKQRHIIVHGGTKNPGKNPFCSPPKAILFSLLKLITYKKSNVLVSLTQNIPEN